MPGTFKTEAIVLRSIRYGEADRILHLYSRERGRIGAVAKGVRRPKSRFGGRLEPLFRVGLVLHEGRGELYTVTSVETIHPHAALRENGAALARATEACQAVLRLFDSAEPTSPPTTFSATSWRCSTPTRRRRQGAGACVPPEAAARRRVRARAGVVCLVRRARAPGRVLRGRRRGGVRGLRGGLVPARRPGARVPRRRARNPLAEVPDAADRAMAQADRAISETLEHHAHVRLGRVAA